MSEIGWAKLSYYLVIGATTGLLLITGTIMHLIAGMILTLIAPAVYHLIASSAEEKIRTETIETTLILAQERYWKIHPIDETANHEDEVQD